MSKRVRDLSISSVPMSAGKYPGPRFLAGAILCLPLVQCGSETDELSVEPQDQLTQQLTGYCTVAFAGFSPAGRQPDRALGVTIDAAAECMNNVTPEYRFKARNPRLGTTTVLCDWQTDAHCDWDTSALSDDGYYTVNVDARRVGATMAEDTASKTYALGSACTAFAVSGSPASASPGTPVQLKADVTCDPGIDLEYLFEVAPPGGSGFTKLGTWQTEDSAEWDTSFFAPGAATLRVHTRRPGYVLKEGTAAAAYKLGDKTCTARSLTIASTGSPRQITATSRCLGGGTPHYRFVRIAPDGFATELQGWSPLATHSWDVTGLTGNQTVRVDVRALETPAQVASSKKQQITFPGGCSSVTLAPLTSPAPIDQSHTFVASANCANPEYSFRVRPMISTVWKVACPYGNAASCNWTAPVGAAAGEYQVAVLVRSAGTVKQESSANGSLVLYDAEVCSPTPERCNLIDDNCNGTIDDGALCPPGDDRFHTLGEMNRPFAVSADGSVVGVNAWGGAAARWTAAGGLEFSPGTEEDGWGYGHGMSDDGTTIVGNIGYGGGRAFRWTAGSDIELLDMGPMAYATNSSGSVVVGASGSGFADPDNILNQRGFRWTPDGWDWIDVDGAFTAATDVSGDGAVVVGRAQYIDHMYMQQPYRWTQSTGTQVFETTDFDLGGNVHVSSDGSTIVWCDLERSFLRRWRESTGAVSLGIGLCPRELSADGSVVVGSGFVVGSGAVMWDVTHGVREILTVLEDNDVDMTGWVFDSALAVSADGKTIVGEGTYNGAWHGWIAKLP